jgi:hypothetical protein
MCVQGGIALTFLWQMMNPSGDLVKSAFGGQDPNHQITTIN